MRIDSWVSGLWLVAVAALTGCGSDAVAGGTEGGVWPNSATQAVVTNQGGGFGPSAPQGSTCDWMGEGSYTFTVRDGKLAWHVCSGAGKQPYAYVDGTRVLSKSEAQTLVAALDKVALYTGDGCGADKPSFALEVTTPSGKRSYLDSFYACNKQGTYVDGIDGVLTAAADLAH